jgi:MtaA/CmuA family methyltransferase
MPITMMFASDFHGSPYLEYATDHRVQSAAQMKLAARFDLDHVSVISDSAIETADCGAEVVFFEDAPAAFNEDISLLRDKSRLDSLNIPDPRRGARMSNHILAVKDLADGVGHERLVEGWVEGPCAQAADLRGINRLMLDFYDDPGFVRALVNFVVELEIAFALAQVEAGAEVIGIGDAAASLIGPSLYEEFIRAGEQRIVAAVHDAGVICRLHICGNNLPVLPSAAKLGCEIIDVDGPTVAMGRARRAAGEEQVLCGNLDPVRSVHDGTPCSIREELTQCHLEAGPRYIVAAGCEIPRGTPLENLEAIVTFAHTTAGDQTS